MPVDVDGEFSSEPRIFGDRAAGDSTEPIRGRNVGGRVTAGHDAGIHTQLRVGPIGGRQQQAHADALPQIGIPSLHRRIRQRPGTGGAAPPQNRVVAVVEGRRGQGLTPLSRIAAARLEAPVRNEERFAEIRAEAEHRALVVDEIGKVGPPFAVRDRRVRNESHEHTEPSPCR